MTSSRVKNATRSARKPQKKIPEPTRLRLQIERLAHKGDGEANTEHGITHIAGTLPHEIVDADIVGERGRLVKVITPSADRVAPPCPAFGSCGGCSLQHMRFDAYLSWKESQLKKTLQSRNIDLKINPIICVAKESRRRVTFAMERQGKNKIFGFHHARSNKIVDIQHCLLLTPVLNANLSALKELGSLLCPKKDTLKIHVLDTSNGLDVRMDGFEAYPDFKTEQQLITLALNNAIARLHLGNELLIETIKPSLIFGKTEITIPPGGFCQATQESQDILSRLVCQHMEGAKYIVDLFSGSGTFSLPLLEKARLHAIEGDESSLIALKEAHSKNPNLKPLTLEKRDLFRRPLSAKELDKFDGLVLDPPRAGAREQVAEIARSKHKKIVYVSCSPASFARDASILLKAGFHLAELTPLDQFIFSHHLEFVGIFER